MDKKYYIANWKSNKTSDEAVNFLKVLQENIDRVNFDKKEVIIAPPFTLLEKCKNIIDANSLPIKLSSQDVSPFPKGAYTGEVNAQQIKEFASYVIIGHSERRRYFNENERIISNKVGEAVESGLDVIQCVQDENDKVEEHVSLVAYEPPSAIGSGNPDSPEHIAEVFNHISDIYPKVKLLYGGSVNEKNINTFLNIKNLSGFLIGGASLNADSFITLLNG